MTEQELKDRIKYLEEKINAAPSWGAAVGAISEELSRLRIQLTNCQENEQ